MNLIIPVFLSILKSSLTASILIVIVLGVQKASNKKLSVRVKNAIWLLVLIKLLIPVSDKMYTNYFEILYERYEAVLQSAEEEKIKPVKADAGYGDSDDLFDNSKRLSLNLVKVASVIWINGVLLLSLWLIISQLNFIRKAKCLRYNIDISGLMRMCNIRTEIPVYQCDDVNSPCILGILKPKIYVPARVLSACNHDQLSYILLHELVHYKRKDLIYNLFSIVALFLHWFNPLVWLAVKKMNLYREAACDACVLEHLGEEENVTYGMTLLSLSKLYAVKQEISKLPVFFEVNNQISERIWLIKGFEKGSYRMKTKALFGCAIAAFIILTNHLPVHALNTDNILMEEPVTPRLYSDEGELAVKPSNGWYLNPEDFKWYFIRDDSYVTGWLNQGEKWFFFDEQGAMINNQTLVINGKEYVFEKSGECINKE